MNPIRRNQARERRLLVEKTDKKLGEGAYGAVFECKLYDEGSGDVTLVAGKFLKVQKTPGADHLTGLLNESTVANLTRIHPHPNIVRYYGMGYEDSPSAGFDYFEAILVMELVESSLDIALAESRTLLPVSCALPFPEKRALNYTKQCLKGIEHLHSLKIIHRDIKPANVLLDSGGTIKIADMGESKLCDLGTRTCTGTPIYMAPEIFTIQGADTSQVYNSKVDVWSVGAMLYEMLTRLSPYSRTFDERKCSFQIGKLCHLIRRGEIALNYREHISATPCAEEASPL
eukprot:CAMPEP_0181328568 /NCGR_PEP_ID=MMETSP1101-20121128/22799_1 /TAXON_ID=46948 /ORGANISM="Rhodomonas abbreviata, Strain Caron Lab Isolate" /LENGTH=286 /DNA_ID=CAMNT_0023437493 /DNA_START=65 /DNA_END=922 /DNA_ORIENTATION=-